MPKVRKPNKKELINDILTEAEDIEVKLISRNLSDADKKETDDILISLMECLTTLKVANYEHREKEMIHIKIMENLKHIVEKKNRIIQNYQNSYKENGPKAIQLMDNLNEGVTDTVKKAIERKCKKYAEEWTKICDELDNSFASFDKEISEIKKNKKTKK